MPFPNEIAAVPLQAGNYLFAAGTPADPTPVFIDQAISIRASAMQNIDLWATAQNRHGASLFYVHVQVGVNEPMREAEKIDLVAYYHPIMNEAPSSE